MRKNIIQSKTELNKNDIWLSEEGLKKYGKNGWEPLGSSNNNSGSSGPVIIEYPLGNTEAFTLTDEQINAAKNYNIRLKINNTNDDNKYVIVVPCFYGIEGESITLYIRMMAGGPITDVIFLIDTINKTIVAIG